MVHIICPHQKCNTQILYECNRIKIAYCLVAQQRKMGKTYRSKQNKFCVPEECATLDFGCEPYCGLLDKTIKARLFLVALR